MGIAKRPPRRTPAWTSYPRIGRPERRDLLQLARKSGDPPTALRFLIIARLGLRKTSSEVAGELDVARSTVVRTAHRYAEQGIAGLYIS